MITGKIQVMFYYLLLLGAIVLTYFIFKPYLVVIALAGILSIVFYPMYKKIIGLFRSPSLSSFVSVVLILLVILVPLTLIGFAMFSELKDLYVRVTLENSMVNYIDGILVNVTAQLDRFLPANAIPTINPAEIERYVDTGFAWIASNFQNIFSGFFSVAINVFILILAMYFFLRDGMNIKKVIMDLSPLTDTDDAAILRKVEVAVNSVIKGSIMIAVLQGILVTVGFVLFHIPSAILWGAVAIFAALVPSLGTSLVVAPAVVYLYLQGDTGLAIGLLLWGVILVGLIDNILRPVLMEKDVKLHPFLILLSVFGGIVFFGPAGFLFGPIILAFLFALLDIYSEVRDGSNQPSV